MNSLRFHSFAKVGVRSALQMICALVLAALAATPASATTVIGDLNNFDTLNDTGQVCYGFEIEIDDIHSTDVTYTFDWNHYGAPKIREDNTDPLHPKVFVRYESTKDSSGSWGANGSLTNMASPTITPPQGHTCTDISVNQGCEHFGVGYYGVPTTIKYNWLVDGGSGNPLVYFGSPVSVAAPAWVYTPPDPNLALPANVVAAIPAPAVPIPVGQGQYGEPSWVKVIKTTTHNANNVVLQELISDDRNNDGLADWQNGEPDQVETEWKLLQANSAGNAAKDELQGGADDMGDGSEKVTRRYEFYRYAADSDPTLPTSIDGENGQAMCDEVESATDLHGYHTLTAVDVAEAGGGSHTVDCTSRIVVGNYIGAQMAGFDAEAALGMVDHLQDGERGAPYMPRTVVIGGNSPYVITILHGNLPPGMSIGDYLDPQTGLTAHGVLSGTPAGGGDFPFTVEATDANNNVVSQTYSLHIAGPGVVQVDLVVQKLGTGSGTVAGNNIDCGLTCAVHLDSGTSVALNATPAVGSIFTGWSGPCSGIAGCTFTLNASSTVYATFVPTTQQYTLSVTRTGSGTVTSSPKGINCGNKQCSKSYTVGTSVTLTAKPAKKHAFLGWTGACAGTSPSCTVEMLSDQSVDATFN